MLTPSTPKYPQTDSLSQKPTHFGPVSGNAQPTSKPLIIEAATSRKLADANLSSFGLMGSLSRSSNEKSVSPVKDELRDIKELKEVISNIINKKEQELSHELFFLKGGKDSGKSGDG